MSSKPPVKDNGYIAVCPHRTGSTFLAEYIKNLYGGNGAFEFLLDWWILNEDGSHTYDKTISPSSVSSHTLLKKLDYLEQKKLRNEHFPIKIIPNSIRGCGRVIENRLTNYLKDYKILTIARNPWDSFMSFLYQTKTNWELSHKRINDPKFERKNIYYEIKEYDILQYATIWWYDIKFICEIEPYHVFNYEDLNTKTLNDFFGKEIKSSMLPLDINYKEHIINYDEARAMFDKYFSGWETALYMMKN